MNKKNNLPLNNNSPETSSNDFELTDQDLDQVAGGVASTPGSNITIKKSYLGDIEGESTNAKHKDQIQIH